MDWWSQEEYLWSAMGQPGKSQRLPPVFACFTDLSSKLLFFFSLELENEVELKIRPQVYLLALTEDLPSQ